MSWLGIDCKIWGCLSQRWSIFHLHSSRGMVSTSYFGYVKNKHLFDMCLPGFSIVKLVYFLPFQTRFLRYEFLFPATLKAGVWRPTFWRGKYQRICGPILKPPQYVIYIRGRYSDATQLLFSYLKVCPPVLAFISGSWWQQLLWWPSNNDFLLFLFLTRLIFIFLLYGRVVPSPSFIYNNMESWIFILLFGS